MYKRLMCQSRIKEIKFDIISFLLLHIGFGMFCTPSGNLFLLEDLLRVPEMAPFFKVRTQNSRVIMLFKILRIRTVREEQGGNVLLRGELQ